MGEEEEEQSVLSSGYYQGDANAGLRIDARAENHVRGLKQENMQLGALQYF